jgi:predicted nucleic acid-binding protein
LERGEVLGHPFVLGELAMGNLRRRELFLAAFGDLPPAVLAADREVRAFVEGRRLHGLGIGYVDAHLLAATRLTRDARFWTCDTRLADVAAGLGLAV